MTKGTENDQQEHDNMKFLDSLQKVKIKKKQDLLSHILLRKRRNSELESEEECFTNYEMRLKKLKVAENEKSLI